MMNLLMIYGIRKCSSLPQTWKTFLLSLAVSDVGVGLVVQPFYSVFLVNWLQQNDSGCNTIMIFQILGNFLPQLRSWVLWFLAVHLHLRYKELVTHRRVVVVVISVWVLSGIFSLLPLWNLYETNSYNWWTYWFSPNSSYIHQDFFVAQRHKNQIQALQVERGEKTCSTLNFDRLFNSLSGKCYVYLVFLVCYLPLFICLAATKINGPNISLKELLLFSIRILNLNSSLKPVIYCWRTRHIRRAIMDILQNLAWNRNHASQ